MNILGITHNSPNFAHDTSAVLVSDGQVVAAAAEERFSRIKHHSGYPKGAIEFALKTGGITNKDIDYVVVPWTRASYRSKIVERWREFRLGDIARRLKGLRPVKINHAGEAVDFQNEFPNAKIVQLDHELSHASSTYRASGMKKALVITVDGDGVDRGRLTSGGVFIGHDGEIDCVELSPLSGSLGYFYSAVTDELGFKCFDGEGKTMGFAAYGDPGACYDKLQDLAPSVDGLRTKRCKNRDARIDIGSGFYGAYDNYFFKYYNNPYLRYLKYRYGAKNLAAAAQKILEDRILELVENAVEATGIKRLCLAGGVFLNVKVNKKIRELSAVKEVFIYPNAGDSGSTAGAALELHHKLTGEHSFGRLESVYFGPEHSDKEIKKELKQGNVTFEKLDDPSATAAELMAGGKVVGWFHGRAEWGPRALGARSVLADPRDGEIKDRINNVLKRREWFMPFAPSILEEDMADYMRDAVASPFMIQAFDVLDDKIDEIPAVVHIDDTARVQSVRKNVNPGYYEAIKAFKDLTGTSVVLNTSFNRHGLPLVNSPQDAVEHLKWGCVDALIIGDYLAVNKA